MTEAEAKERWCPAARVVSDPAILGGAREASGFNRMRDREFTLLPQASRCIASGCMWWRWHPTMMNRKPDSGYCGAAGDARHEP
jgi:hypothetical protein